MWRMLARYEATIGEAMSSRLSHQASSCPEVDMPCRLLKLKLNLDELVSHVCRRFAIPTLHDLIIPSGSVAKTQSLIPKASMCNKVFRWWMS